MLLGLTVSPALLATGLKGETDVAESGYFAVRWLLAKSVAEAARFIAERGGVAEGAAVLVRLIAQIVSDAEE